MNCGEPNSLELVIFRTLVWFSLFNYPLNTFELWKNLYEPNCSVSLLEIENFLKKSFWLNERVFFKDGFWLLKTQPLKIIEDHQNRFLNAVQKFKKLRWAAGYFSLFPFVRAVFACNNLPWHNTAPGSDIDLFIVVEPGTIWLSRLLLVAPFKFFGRRPLPTKDNTNDPFCFSFFATTQSLDFKPLFLKEGDPYFVFWTASLVPIFDRGEIQKKIWQENLWLKESLPNAFPGAAHQEIQPNHLLILPLGFLKRLEKFVSYFQQKFLPCEIRDAANCDSKVVISDHLLKFHTNDKRAYFRDQWKKIYEA